MKKRKILIVDDESDIRKLIAKFFEKKNYQAIEVESGLFGLNLLGTDNFDVLISDIQMPYMDGIDFVRRAKKISPDLVVVLLTGCGSLNTAQEAIRIGIHEYLTKPVDSEKLFSSVEAGLKKVEEKKKNEDYFLGLKEEIGKDKKRFESMEKDFISLINHELRTPVAIISEGISFLKDTFEMPHPENLENSTNEQRDRIFEIIENGRRRLVKTIEDITEYMNLSKKNVVLNKENIDICNFLEENFSALSQLITDSRVLLKKDFIRDETDLVCIDKDRLLDVLSRIVLNAANHNPKGTEIIVKIYFLKKEQGNSVIINVADNGKGIAKELLENIFKPFNVDDMMHHSKGLGLGLCICKGIIELHNGSIKVESQQGQGTVVSIEIPKVK